MVNDIKLFKKTGCMFYISGNFEQYDFGPIENMKKYNSLRPPRYNLTNIKTPIAILYAPNDDLNTEQVK